MWFDLWILFSNHTLIQVLLLDVFFLEINKDSEFEELNVGPKRNFINT